MPPVARLAADLVPGPEDLAVEPTGDLLAGTADGRILRYRTEAGTVEEIARTGGHPLGVALAGQGRLLIADARRGLLAVTASGEVHVLATGEGGLPFRFTNGVAMARSGAVYFTDASWRHGPEDVFKDLLEGRPNGRLLRYDPATGSVERLLDGLYFANGVAVDPDERFVLVAETFAYRVTRYWLQGPQAGRSGPFIENLPGLPDGISYNGEGLYWVALYAPRNRLLDALPDWPWLRWLLARLPAFLLPGPERYGHILGLDGEGRVVFDLRDPSGSYAPISSARQAGPWLYLGSLTERGIGRVAVPAPTETPRAAGPGRGH
jgi:sugar lactone lactonase YvrE